MDDYNHRKNIFYVIIIVIILLLVFGSVYYYFKVFKKGATSLTVEQEIELQEQVVGIIKTNDFNGCDQIEDEIYRTACVNNIAMNLAQEKQDISYCEKIDNKLMSIASCERRVLFKKSLAEEHISICNETENNEIQQQCKDRFWPLLAVKKGDIDLCQNVFIDDYKVLCVNYYIFEQEFLKNEKNFDCKKFNLEQFVSDCRIYKEQVSSNELNDCYIFESDSFVNYCILKTR
ncbi:MAG: hypothetical protein U9Q16_00700 [Patescibacteria group bacterium]|nr:hypothetical protein [Patescibacteria group bacterium]